MWAVTAAREGMPMMWWRKASFASHKLTRAPRARPPHAVMCTGPQLKGHTAAPIVCGYENKMDTGLGLGLLGTSPACTRASVRCAVRVVWCGGEPS